MLDDDVIESTGEVRGAVKQEWFRHNSFFSFPEPA
jgi:hypothetical protein